MSWLFLDDHFGEDPRLLRVGAEAAWMHTQAMSYCARLLTDGQISEPVARSFSPRWKTLARKLEGERLWLAVDGGWSLPEFIAWNKTRAKVEEGRRERAEAGRKGGLKSGEVRSKGEASASASASEFASSVVEPQSRPVPSPVPRSVERESVSLAQQATSGYSARASASAKSLLEIEGCLLTVEDATAIVDTLTDQLGSEIVLAAIESLRWSSDGFKGKTKASQISGITAWVKRQKPPLLRTIQEMFATAGSPQWILEEAGVPGDGLEHASRESLECVLRLLREEHSEASETDG